MTIWSPPKDLPGRQNLVGHDLLPARIMADRGIDTLMKAEDFLYPYLGQIHKPSLLPDILPATKLIKQAISEGWPVRLITDYDVDGQTSGALFYLFLRDQYRLAGHDPDLIDCFTPNRFSEGYGLNRNHILGAALDSKRLVITFDCGIRSHAEGELANEHGLHLIITDHHEPKGTLIPLADAVINPKRHDSQYPFPDICGCIVALKLAWAIGGSLRKLLPYFDLAAVATVADFMPITDENRTLLYYGMMVLNGEDVVDGNEVIYSGGRRPSLDLLLDGKKILETDIGFKVGPPLNALGRMGDANRGIRFLTESNRDVLKKARQDIDAENALRKVIQQEVVDEICATIDPENPPSAIVYSSNFSRLGANAEKVEGVVGIAATKVGEIFHVPVIVLSEQHGIAKGSGRAIIPLDLHATLEQIDHLLIKWGGHQAAAGMSLKPENVPALREHLERATQQMRQEDLIQKLQVDAVITGRDLAWRDGYPLLRQLDILRPFGKDNPVPLLLLKEARVVSRKQIKDVHLKLQLEAEGVTFEAIAWREWERYADAGHPELLDILGEAGINDWSGKLQVTVRDWRAT